MPSADKTERFIRHLTETQDQLYGYVHALLADSHAAQDVLQETNVVLWRKFDEFTEGTSFLAWARRVALFQIKAHRRDMSRERLLFDDALLDVIAQDAEARGPLVTARSEALEVCLAKLGEEQRELVTQRYGEAGASLREIAQRTGKSLAAVTMALSRIRHALVECVERESAREGGR